MLAGARRSAIAISRLRCIRSPGCDMPPALGIPADRRPRHIVRSAIGGGPCDGGGPAKVSPRTTPFEGHPMFRRTLPSLFLVSVLSVAAACGSDPATPPANPPGATKLTGFAAGQVADSTPTPSAPAVPTGTQAVQVGGTVKGVGPGRDTMATSVIVPGVEVKAFKHMGYSGNDVLVGEQVGSTFTTGANGWYGYIALLPGKYVVTF